MTNKRDVVNLVKARKIAVSNYQGEITAKIQNSTFDRSSAIVSGTITITGGKME